MINHRSIRANYRETVSKFESVTQLANSFLFFFFLIYTKCSKTNDEMLTKCCRKNMKFDLLLEQKFNEKKNNEYVSLRFWNLPQLLNFLLLFSRTKYTNNNAKWYRRNVTRSKVYATRLILRRKIQLNRDNYKDSLYFFEFLRELKAVWCSESDWNAVKAEHCSLVYEDRINRNRSLLLLLLLS